MNKPSRKAKTIHFLLNYHDTGKFDYPYRKAWKMFSDIPYKEVRKKDSWREHVKCTMLQEGAAADLMWPEWYMK